MAKPDDARWLLTLWQGVEFGRFHWTPKPHQMEALQRATRAICARRPISRRDRVTLDQFVVSFGRFVDRLSA